MQHKFEDVKLISGRYVSEEIETHEILITLLCPL